MPVQQVRSMRSCKISHPHGCPVSHHVTAINQSPTCRRCDIATIEGFVHKGTVLQMALYYLEAIHSKVPDLVLLMHSKVGIVGCTRWCICTRLGIRTYYGMECAHHWVSGLVFCRCERASLACNYRHAGVVSMDFTLFFRESAVLPCSRNTLRRVRSAMSHFMHNGPSGVA